MNKIRFFLALWISKLSIIALKITKHNGTNFPIQNVKTGKIYNSAQNLTHYIDGETINYKEHDIIFTNLLDNTVAGIKYIGKNIIGISFNPEANPGNKEIEILFDVFASMINK